jgi:hypothetical protein
MEKKIQLVFKSDFLFCISKTSYVLAVLSKDHFLELVDDSKEVPLGGSDIVL